MSHRRAKRLRRMNRAQSRNALLEYCTFPLYTLHSQLGVEPIQRPHGIRAAFWCLVPPGEYAGTQAPDIPSQYVATVERELCEQLGKNSIGYFLHLYRRLAPGAAGDNDSSTTTAITRATLEAAYQNVPQTRPRNRIANSDDVSIEAILRGEFAKSSRPFGPGKLRSQLVL